MRGHGLGNSSAVPSQTSLAGQLSWNQFAKDLCFAALTLVPIGYIGLLFAVAIHEIVGHGMAAMLVGGEFHGFVLRWDGMGHARTALPDGARPWHEIAVLASGVCSTILVGTVLLLASLKVRSTCGKFVLLILAANCLLEGFPYMFWNAYHPEPPGDMARILMLLGESESGTVDLARGAMLIVGGVGMTGATYLASRMLLVLLMASMSERPLDQHFRPIVIGVIVVAGAAGSFTFDWNQLAPGIGSTPQWIGAITFVLAGLALCFRPRPVSLPSAPLRLSHCIAAWLALVAVGITMRRWLVDGLFFK